jgi:hypothetical protein
VTLDQRLPGGHRFLLFLACSPLSARRCRSFTWNARTYRLEPENDAELAAFQALILDHLLVNGVLVVGADRAAGGRPGQVLGAGSYA